MNKLYNLFKVFFAATLLIFISVQARATHTMWSELTYSCASPGIYVVQLKIYRDCSAAGLPATTSLIVKAPGCNTGRNITLQKLNNTRLGNMYCPSVPNVCSTSGRFNFEETAYVGTVNFTATEQACPDWVLSWSDCCRQSSTNIVNPTAEPLYTEARLKILPGMVNNSPQFGPMVSNQVAFNEPIQLSNYAIDPDGDSLVYSVQNPLKEYNTIINYTGYSTVVLYNSDSTKFSPLMGNLYSNSFPIITYSIDWSQPMPLYPVKNFGLNVRTGNYTFTPGKFVPNATYNMPDNKYTFVVQVDEYRKINGVATKIGSVRRDMILAVVNGVGNKNPAVTNPTANGHAIIDNEIINLRPGIPLNFQVKTADGNTTDVIALTSDVADILPGAVFTKTSTSKPTGTVTWIPTAAHIRSQPYYFHVFVADDACPVKGYQIHTFGVKVTANGSVTGTSEKVANQVSFTAFPNPFSEELNFRIGEGAKGESIVIYNLLGEKIDQISVPQNASGGQPVRWENARRFAAGTYVARLVSKGQTVQTIKFTRLQ